MQRECKGSATQHARRKRHLSTCSHGTHGRTTAGEELIARKKRSERKREKKKKKKKKTRTKSKKKKKKRKGKHKRTRMEKVVTIVRAPKYVAPTLPFAVL